MDDLLLDGVERTRKMVLLIEGCVLLLVVLIIFNALIDKVTLGDAASNLNLANLIEGIIAIVFLYAVIITLCASNLVEFNGIPFLDKIDMYESISNMYHNGFSDFLMECTELISLTFLVSLVTKLIPSEFLGKGFSGAVFRNIAIVLLCVIINSQLLSYMKGNKIFEWAVAVLRSVFCGAALAITPAIIIGNLLHVRSDNPFVTFLIRQLPQSNIGKAMSSAVVNSLVLVFIIIAFETQFGSITSFAKDIAVNTGLIEIIFIFVFLMMALKFALRAIFEPPKKDK